MKRLLVGMSGGVDSSVAALLLKQQGFEVIGVTLNLWSYENREEPYNECCSLEVRTVAQQLGIEHHFVDAGREFKERVIESFLDQHKRGLTPSPCGRCNRLVRFPVMLELAERFGCDYLATGHHARIAAENGLHYLLTGRDPRKDQSYFLYGLAQEQLRRVLFPVGHLLKSEVWQIARAHNLISARKPESMDLCFIPQGDYRAYVKANLNGALRPGEVVDRAGRVVGHHQGLPLYTIGQRQGLGISLGERAYVIGFDHEKNRLIVGEERDLYSGGFSAGDINFVYPRDLHQLSTIDVQIRYRSPRVPATLELLQDQRILVRLAQPQRAVTPGQLAVFYEGERVLGGGTIAKALRQTDIPQKVAQNAIVL